MKKETVSNLPREGGAYFAPFIWPRLKDFLSTILFAALFFIYKSRYVQIQLED